MKTPVHRPKPQPPASLQEREHQQSARGKSEIIKTSPVTGSVIVVTTIKRDDPFLIYAYETCAVDGDGAIAGEVIRNSVITTALHTHEAMVHALVHPAPVKRSLGRYRR